MKLFVIIAAFCVINSAFATSWPSTTLTTAAHCYAATGITNSATCVALDDAATAGSKCCHITFTSNDPHLSSATTTALGTVATWCFKLGGNLKLPSGSDFYETAGNQFCKADAYSTAITGTILASDVSSVPTTLPTIKTASAITTCTCSSRVSATIFTIGFSLLAILASLWK